jgi:outer membrane protein assembly factor BamB
MDSVAYFGTDNLYAVNPELGLLWIHDADDFYYSGPVITSQGDVCYTIWNPDAFPEYIPSDATFLICVDPQGDELWQAGPSRLRREVKIGPSGNVYFTEVDGFGETYSLSAVSSTGANLWSQPIMRSLHCTPAILADAGEEQILAAGARFNQDGLQLDSGYYVDHGITIDAEQRVFFSTINGYLEVETLEHTALWHYPQEAGSSDERFSPVAVSPAGAVLFMFFDDRDDPDRLFMLNADGSLRWEKSLPGHTFPVTHSFVLLDSSENCFAGYGNELFAWSADGAELWTHALSSDLFTAPLSIAPNGNLYTLTAGGDLLVVSADAQQFMPAPAL